MSMITNACESVCVQVAALSFDETFSFLKRRSDGFSHGSSKFRGVSRNEQRGKWVSSTKHQGNHVFLGYYNTELEAAQAYDRAAIRCRGKKAVTNFDVNEYKTELAEFEDPSLNELHVLIKAAITKYDALIETLTPKV